MATTAPISRPSRWPWIVLGVTAAFAAVGLVFVSLNGYSLLGDATNFIAFMGMGIVGALSLSRAPDNRIGWLLLWVAVTVGAAFTTVKRRSTLPRTARTLSRGGSPGRATHSGPSASSRC